MKDHNKDVASGLIAIGQFVMALGLMAVCIGVLMFLV